MTFKPPKKQPTFADLKGILAQTQLDNTTYQVIEGLIDRLTQFQSLIMAEIMDIIKSVDEGKGLKGDRGPQGPQGPPGTIGPHQSTHRPGGSDVLVNNAWTDQANTFTQPQKIQATDKQLELVGANGVQPILQLNNPTHAPDSRKARLLYTSNQVRIDFVNDVESGTVGAQITFNRDTGLFVVSGGGQFGNNVDVAGHMKITGSYLHTDGQPALSLASVGINIFSDQVDFINKINSGYLMRLNSAGTLNTSGNVIAGGLVRGNNFSSSGTVNDCAYFIGPQYARTHWRNMSAAPGSQTWVIINYEGYLRIAATSDDGLTPHAGSWGHSFYIGRSGDVNIGPGGLYIERVNNGPGLASGQFTPVVVAYTSNIGSALPRISNFSRVGNIIFVSGQVDISTSGAVGTFGSFKMTPPINYVVTAKGIIVDSEGVNVGYINQDAPGASMDVNFRIKAVGTFAFFFTYSYQYTP